MKNLLLLLVTAVLVAVTLTSCDIADPADSGQLVPFTVDEDSSLPAIHVNGTHLHAETFGNPDNPMLVVLHGGPGGDYRSLLKCSAFAGDGFFVVFYDQRGSGLSRRHSKDVYETQLFIDDLDSVIRYYRRTPNQKIFLLGQSWGAMLATAYVNQHPERISGVVLSEPGGFTFQDMKDYVARERAIDVFSETANDYLFLDQLVTGRDHIKLDYKLALQNAASFAPGNSNGNAGPVPFWRFGAVCSAAAFTYVNDHHFDFTTNLGAYTTRILFLYSELNTAYGKAHAELVSSAYPNVQRAEIKGTGHEIPWFGWENFYPVAKSYLISNK